MLRDIRPEAVGPARISFILVTVVLLGVLLFVLTYLGIQKSRSDSLELLRQQGVAQIEGLVLSADNAIKAGSLFDLLAQEKFSDLVGFLETKEDTAYSSPELADFASGYGVDAILIFDNEMNLKASGARGVFIDLNRIYSVVVPELESMVADEAVQSSFRIIEGSRPGEMSIVYLQKTTDRKNIFAIVSDALFYVQAKENIGIGYLVRNIAREIGIEYILFQTKEGIIFSSRKLGPVLKVEKDPFLLSAFASDTIISREHTFNERKILELVKRFSSDEYGDGLFRLGISLEKYYDIMSGFDRQMIVLSLVIFAVLVLLILYLNGKQQRIYLDRSYHRMKSLSETVFDSINSGIVAIRTNGTIEMANRQFLKIFGAENENVVGRAWANFDFKNVIPLNEIISGEKSTGETESIITMPSGQRYLLLNTGRLYDHNNNVSGAVAVVYDYTHIHELEEAARRKERLTELGDLAAGVAHEIRNPLNAISIAAQRLLGEFEPKENADEFKSFAGQIKSEARRLDNIVNRFLSMARGQSKRNDKILISEVVDDAVRLVAMGHDREDIFIRTDISPGIEASLPADRIKQLVINLTRNAVQACEEKGGEVSVALKKENSEIVLSVKDTGGGISDEIKKKIFSPYFTTRNDGTGLGLSIVHQIVEESNGRIEVLAPDGGGTEFRVIFS